MRYGRFGASVLALGFCALGCAAADPPKVTGASSFDGLYSGTSTINFGSAPVCGSDFDLSLPVRDGTVAYQFGDFPLKFSIAEDGTFRYRISVGSRGRRHIATHGKIAGQLLEADLTVRVPSLRQHLCSYHWSLKRT